MQTTLKLEAELSSIISRYSLGNRKDAARSIRKLSKPKLAHLLIHLPYINEIVNVPYRSRLGFEGFVMSALDNDL